MQPGLLARLDDAERLRGLRGQLAQGGDDPVLDAIVREASALAGAPMAMVSLVLRQHQTFRAQVGLPNDLAVSRATSRDASFCQFVVAIGRGLVVGDAQGDAELPQELVERYGIRAYAGVPLHVDGQPLGSLCVLDTVPHQFSAEVLRRLEELGGRAQARLTELASQPAVGNEQVLAPAVAQARNQAAALRLQSDLAVQLLVELQPLERLLRGAESLADAEVAMGLRSLRQSAQTLGELRGLCGELLEVGERLSAVVTTLGDTLLGKRFGAVTLGSVVQAAQLLCGDLVRVFGPLQVAPHDPAIALAQPYSDAVLLVGRALADALSRGPGGAQLRFQLRPEAVVVEAAPAGGGPAVQVSLQRTSALQA
jgi:GAF domain-containing protein